MKKLFTIILSWLLHQANREGGSPEFYVVKNKILKKYGWHIGYDVQFINGKKCNSCGGSGVHAKYGYNGRIYDYADCYHCNCGWYKLPVWNILQRLQFGKYIFHQPWQRVYTKPATEFPVIEGYIEHTPAQYGEEALFILFLIYEKGYLKRWWKSAGYGWRYQWWKPYNLMHNVIHLCKRRGTAIPVYNFRLKVERMFKKPVLVKSDVEYCDVDELPF
jgi:hypothetical protein